MIHRVSALALEVSTILLVRILLILIQTLVKTTHHLPPLIRKIQYLPKLAP